MLNPLEAWPESSLFQHLAKLSWWSKHQVCKREKKEMSWMHVLSVLWGTENLFNG
jgi:hypothetical protein